MAIKLGVMTLNGILFIKSDVNPSLGIGMPASVGSFCSAVDGSGFFYKSTDVDTGWYGTILNSSTDLGIVISQTNTPSGTVTGDRYLVGLAPTGVFVGHSNEIADYNSGTGLYTFTLPVTGNTVFVTATLSTLRYNGTSFIAYSGTAALNNGNTLGASLILGTNDAFDLIFKRNNVQKASATSTGFALRNAANTFQTEFQNTVSANRIITIPDFTGTMMISVGGSTGRIPYWLNGTSLTNDTNFTKTGNRLQADGSTNGVVDIKTSNFTTGTAAVCRFQAGVTNGGSIFLGMTDSNYNPVGLLVGGIGHIQSTTSIGVLNSITGGYYKYAIGGSGSSNLVATLDVNGLALETVGMGFKIKEGSNATMGIATLVGGTVTVNTTKTTANSRIFLTVNGVGVLANLGNIYEAKANRIAGTSFIIKSSNSSDTSVVVWQIIEPS